MELIFKQYGLRAVIISAIIAILVWILAHITAAPGTKVSVLWGLAEYTKTKIQIETLKPQQEELELKSEDLNYQSLTVENIAEKINSATPFQQENIAKSFVGVKVKWEGWLEDVEILDTSNVRVKLSTKKSGYHSFYFDTTTVKYPKFKVLDRGAKLLVSGIISRASGPGLNVKLEGVTVY